MLIFKSTVTAVGQWQIISRVFNARRFNCQLSSLEREMAVRSIVKKAWSLFVSSDLLIAFVSLKTFKKHGDLSF